nr:8167_t:CDS:2 [Entrophospora candida]
MKIRVPIVKKNDENDNDEDNEFDEDEFGAQNEQDIKFVTQSIPENGII